MKKVEIYDIIRVLATLFVVIGHASYRSWSGDSGYIELKIVNAANSYRLISRIVGGLGGWVYGFHMALFFTLAGAVYKYSRHISTFDELVINKAKRLFIPFMTTALLYMFPLKRLVGFYNNTNIISAVEGFFYGANTGHLWFLIALFWAFILFYPLEKYVLQNMSGGGYY